MMKMMLGICGKAWAVCWPSSDLHPGIAKAAALRPIVFKKSRYFIRFIFQKLDILCLSNIDLLFSFYNRFHQCLKFCDFLGVFFSQIGCLADI